MSYADYRTGGGRRPVPERDAALLDSFAGAGAGPSTAAAARASTATVPTPAPAPAPVPMASVNASAFYTSTASGAGARVDNPYSTSAYASSRGGTGGGGPGGGGGGAGPGAAGAGGGPEFYVNARQKGNRQGRLKDTIKNTMAAAKQDNWKVVCVKATNHDIAAPKGKHVRVIMQGLQWGGSITNRESPAGGIFYHLRKRMMANEWVVTVKAQTIFHHIFRDGNEKFVTYIAANARSVFRMEFFADATSDGFAHASFIKTYGAYIEQWLAMKAAVDYPAGKSKEDDPANTTRYRSAGVEELLAALPVMMDTLDALVGIDLSGQIKFSPVATPAFSMILRDLTLLWVAMSEGMIRLLDLYFNLEIPIATIALDVYKRFVEMVNKAQPFFDVARSLNVRWQTPTLGAISLDLIDSMEKYLTIGPQGDKQEEKYSDEEVYEPEPRREPEPDHYYAPEPEFYSSEEEEVEHRPPSPPVSVSSSSSEEEESSSSEDEPEPVPVAAPPPPPPQPKKFDPLADLLGITEGVTAGAAAAPSPTNGAAMMPQNQVALYNGGPNALVQRATLEQTVDDRVANVKGMMAAGGAAAPARQGFGVDGANMQVALYGQNAGNPQQQQQQQMLAYQQQQQQAQLAAYQTMAAYQSMAMYQSMAGMNGMNPAAAYAQQQQMSMNPAYAQQMQMAAQQQAQAQQMAQARMQQQQPAVPAMQAQHVSHAGAAYRVTKSKATTRVNESDQAFGPILEQMKQQSK